MGLFLNEATAFNGYTLMSNNETTYLIDNCGFVVNTWESEYKTGHGLYFFDNGDLLRAGRFEGTGAYDAGGLGGVLERYNWNGDLVWSYEIANTAQHAHHDLEILPNGNILCSVWERKSENEAQANGRAFSGDVWSERILEIEPVGSNQANIVWEWSIWDHLIQEHDPSKLNYGTVANAPEKIDVNYIGAGEETSGNWLHINAIDYWEAEDLIVLSARNLSEFYVVDHSTSSQEAASSSGGNKGKGGDILYRYGNPQVYQNDNAEVQKLGRQHHVQFLPDDHPLAPAFSVFNNEWMPNAQSRIEIIRNPISETGEYLFDATNGFGADSLLFTYTFQGMYSDILSGVQVLPNNNYLILEGRSGEITEIDEEENLVWKYIYPVNRNGGPGIQTGTVQFNSLFRAKRYPADFIGFQDKDLTPTVPIELLPLSSDCEIYENSTGLLEQSHSNLLSLKFDAVSEKYTVINERGDSADISIYNLQGQLVKQLKMLTGDPSIEFSLPVGNCYILQSKSEGGCISKKLCR